MKLKKIFYNLSIFVLLGVLVGCATPSLMVAKQRVASYYEEGRYEKDVASLMEKAKKLIPADGGYNVIGNAIVFDIDDTALNTYEYQKGMGFGHYGVAWHQWIHMRRATAVKPVLDFYNYAQSKGISVFFVSGRREKFREDTAENLRAVGFRDWKGLYMKPDDFKSKSVVDFKTSQRIEIEKLGYRILLNIGDQPSDLEGGHAEHVVLLPNLIYGVR